MVGAYPNKNCDSFHISGVGPNVTFASLVLSFSPLIVFHGSEDGAIMEISKFWHNIIWWRPCPCASMPFWVSCLSQTKVLKLQLRRRRMLSNRVKGFYEWINKMSWSSGFGCYVKFLYEFETWMRGNMNQKDTQLALWLVTRYLSNLVNLFTIYVSPSRVISKHYKCAMDGTIECWVCWFNILPIPFYVCLPPLKIRFNFKINTIWNY